MGKELERRMSTSLQGENIIVYGEFSFDARKYPRTGVNADVILITFLMHEEFLRGCARSLELAIKYFNGCKEYFYVYHSPGGGTRRYSAREIIQLNQTIFNLRVGSPAEYVERIRPYNDIDQCYISYIRTRNFYISLLDAVMEAKEAHFQRREFSYRLQPPMELYGHYSHPIQGQIYSAYDLMEIYTYANYLKKHGIVKELPMPSFTRKIQESRQMNRIYSTPSARASALAPQGGAGGSPRAGLEEILGSDGSEIPVEKQTLGYKLRKIQEEKRRQSPSFSVPSTPSVQAYTMPSHQRSHDSKNMVSGAVTWDSKRNNIMN